MKGCRAALLGLLLANALSGALAGEVYRCDERGLVYQDQPCEGSGSLVELQVYQPSAEAIRRAEASHQRLRALLDRVTPAPAAQSEQSHPTPSQVAARAAAEPSSARERRRYHPDRSATDACPLGLNRCLKPDPPVYRRPKSRSGLLLAPTPKSTQHPVPSP